MSAHLELLPIDTSPITFADGATKAADSDTTGATPSTATNRVDGTRRSVCLATSIPAPILSRACLLNLKCQRKRVKEKTIRELLKVIISNNYSHGNCRLFQQIKFNQSGSMKDGRILRNF